MSPIHCGLDFGTSLFADATRIKRHAVPFVEVLGVFSAKLKKRSEAALSASIDSAGASSATWQNRREPEWPVHSCFIAVASLLLRAA
ncbi:MAG: hypothetical protein ACYC0C_10795 [Devosia sp.]